MGVRGYTPPFRSRHLAIPPSQHVANMNIVFKYLTSCVKLVGIGPQDIVDSSNETLVMGMIW